MTASEARPRERDPEELIRENQTLRARLEALERARSAFSSRGEILEAFFKHTQTSLVLLDRDFNFVRVNDAYARACQRNPSEFLGHNHFELYPSPLIEDFKRVVHERKPWSVAARPFVFPDHPEWGTTYWDLALVPICDAHGEVEHLVFSLHDVTPIIRAEEALRDSEARYRQAQKMEAIGRLAGGVAHDFNNLLCVINAYAALALESVPRDSTAHRDIGEVLAAGERAATLTRRLLAFSRQQVLEPRVISLNQTVCNVEQMLGRVIGEDVELRIELCEDLYDVLADPGQLELVVLNLAVNARDAMPAGGKLVISTANVTIPAGGASAEGGLGPGKYVELRVSDTGLGMDEPTQARIFEPFFTTKPVGKGTGLGLATVHGIVQQSGGAISVHSAPGQGATFVIRMPCAPAQVENERRETSQVLAPATDRRILVVEDEEVVRVLLVRVLRSAGYDVLAAADGREALAVCEQSDKRIDLVLTDVIMPHMGGPELVSRLGQKCPGLKIIFMSGYAADATALETELRAGMHFIPKPLNPDALLRKVQSALE